MQTYVGRPYSIPSSSMEPQLQVGDRVVVSRTAYRLHDARRGDIVVFPPPSSTAPDETFIRGAVADILETTGIREPRNQQLIKRVLGLPGETIGAEGGHVVVDGRVVSEPYLDETVVTGDFGPVDIPAGYVFVMGDNRGNSSDSRFIGPIEIDTIVGRAIARIWPPERAAFL